MSPSREFDTKCDTCDQTFTTKSEFENHVENRHSIYHQCSFCDKNYDSNQDLLTHVQALHKNTRYSCEICSKSYSYPGGLKRHKLHGHHGNVQKFKCGLCCIEFGFKDGLKRHLKDVHSKEFTFKCELCSKLFNAKGNLDSHKRLFHDKVQSQPCPKCGKMYLFFRWFIAETLETCS